MGCMPSRDGDPGGRPTRGCLLCAQALGRTRCASDSLQNCSQSGLAVCGWASTGGNVTVQMRSEDKMSQGTSGAQSNVQAQLGRDRLGGSEVTLQCDAGRATPTCLPGAGRKAETQGSSTTMSGRWKGSDTGRLQTQATGKERLGTGCFPGRKGAPCHRR